LDDAVNALPTPAAAKQLEPQLSVAKPSPVVPVTHAMQAPSNPGDVISPSRHRKVRSTPSSFAASVLAAKSVYLVPAPVPLIAVRAARLPTSTSSQHQDPSVFPDSISGFRTEATPARSRPGPLHAVDAGGSPPASHHLAGKRFPLHSSTRPEVPPSPTPGVHAFSLSDADTRLFRKSEAEHKAMVALWLANVPTKSNASQHSSMKGQATPYAPAVRAKSVGLHRPRAS
jgi:hypothetical protein